MNVISITANGLTINFDAPVFNAVMGKIAQGGKINAIKELRTYAPHLGLRECKEFVEALGGYREGQASFTPPAVPFTPATTAKQGLGAYALLDMLSGIKESVKDAITGDAQDRVTSLFNLYERVSQDHRDESDRLRKAGVAF